jgi:hypothetical protein
MSLNMQERVPEYWCFGAANRLLRNLRTDVDVSWPQRPSYARWVNRLQSYCFPVIMNHDSAVWDVVAVPFVAPEWARRHLRHCKYRHVLFP